MATVKPIEGRSVHQIQSGQVIVDICSVAKELVENALDADATSIEVRFKNQGLDAIEVQDNGSGIAPENFESIALKHYTSKLSSYADLSNLHTFGFRGEALSSLCALSKFYITTARAVDGAKGTRLDFQVSGKLAGTSVVPCPRGTTVVVDELFKNLPVRRRELEKNIKREYAKVLAVLHAYACVCTGVKFTVTNTMTKGKKTTVFSTKSNPTTKENIANVYGARTLLALVPLDLTLHMEPTRNTQSILQRTNENDDGDTAIKVVGHISRPVVGEGRQTPDRQMFFVNSRPCQLPQVAKAINEVYKGYNVTQSPFIFADLRMDTNAYDVNVSPDKRTILLHDQTALLEALKEKLVEKFENHDQSVPQSQLLSNKKLPAYRHLTLNRGNSTNIEGQGNPVTPLSKVDEPLRRSNSQASEEHRSSSSEPTSSDLPPGSIHLIRAFAGRNTEDRTTPATPDTAHSTDKRRLSRLLAEKASFNETINPEGSEIEDPQSTRAPTTTTEDAEPERTSFVPSPRVQDFNRRMQTDEDSAELNYIPPSSAESQPEERIPSIATPSQKGQQGVVQNAFDRTRPIRRPQEIATITIGDQTVTSTIGSQSNKRRRLESFNQTGSQKKISTFLNLRAFAAPGTQASGNGSEDDNISEDENNEPQDEDFTTADRQSSEESDSLFVSQDPNTRSTAQSEPAHSSPAESEASDADENIETERNGETAGKEIEEENKSDGDYIDESSKKVAEEARVARMIAEAEEAAARPSDDNIKRASKVLKGGRRKDSTLRLAQYFDISVENIQERADKLLSSITRHRQSNFGSGDAQLTREESNPDRSPEERLSLTVSKEDFAQMRVVGQFNLGFILAVRPPTCATNSRAPTTASATPELFIIDQHASDEKYNFERLSRLTILSPQPLVTPLPLHLSAIDEETLISSPAALTQNGFRVQVSDDDDETPVGQRCTLLTLPSSREAVFDVKDLEELLVLLSERVGEKDIPRPAKVRRLLAMRACRGSIMVGKSLGQRQMERVVRNLGQLDKPWNCPHGRPTMRHLTGLGSWSGWSEGEGVASVDQGDVEGMEAIHQGKVDWGAWMRRQEEMRGAESSEDEIDRDERG